MRHFVSGGGPGKESSQNHSCGRHPRAKCREEISPALLIPSGAFPRLFDASLNIQTARVQVNVFRNWLDHSSLVGKQWCTAWACPSVALTIQSGRCIQNQHPNMVHLCLPPNLQVIEWCKLSVVNWRDSRMIGQTVEAMASVRVWVKTGDGEEVEQRMKGRIWRVGFRCSGWHHWWCSAC